VDRPGEGAGQLGARRSAGNGEEKWQIALKQTFPEDLRYRAPRRQVVQPHRSAVRGADVAFAFVDGNGVKRQFTGRAAGDRMDGSTTTQGGAKVNWTAARGRAS